MSFYRKVNKSPPKSTESSPKNRPCCHLWLTVWVVSVSHYSVVILHWHRSHSSLLADRDGGCFKDSRLIETSEKSRTRDRPRATTFPLSPSENPKSTSMKRRFSLRPLSAVQRTSHDPQSASRRAGMATGERVRARPSLPPSVPPFHASERLLTTELRDEPPPPSHAP